MTRKYNGKWSRVELGEIIDIFDSIRVPLNSRQRAERQGKYPYYGASGIIDSVDGYLFDGEYVLVAEDGENLNSRKLPVAFMARGQFWVNNHAHIIKGKSGVADDRFLIAWFAQADIKGYITGAAQPKLSQANLKRIALTAPPYST
jgi:type I restriction enzyme S subunit